MAVKMKKLICLSLLFVLLFSSVVLSLPQKMAALQRLEKAEQRHRHRMEVKEVGHRGQIQSMTSYFSARAARVRHWGLAPLRHIQRGRYHRLGYYSGSILD